MADLVPPQRFEQATLPQIRGVLKGIAAFCDNILADENVFHVQETTVGPFNSQYATVLRQLKATYGAVFDEMKEFSLRDYRFREGNVSRELLYALRNSANYGLVFVEHELSEQLLASGMRGGRVGAVELVSSILSRFSSALKRLQSRPGNKPSLITISNEKDLQDLVHCFLQLHFDDIRREESVPSHAGAGSFIDFLLKSEKIGIEVKGPREGLKDIKAGAELLEDIAKYQGHPDCNTLILFIYDPDHEINNPAGIIGDLQSASKPGEFEIIAIIVPPRH